MTSNVEAGTATSTGAARERGHACRRIDYRTVVASVNGHGERAVDAGELPLQRCDAVLVRTMPPGSLEQVVFRMDALLTLEHAGVTVLNPPKAVECAVDKYLCTARLAAAGLPVPETWMVPPKDYEWTQDLRITLR